MKEFHRTLQAIRNLTPTERKVLELRCGFRLTKQGTLADIGKKLGVTRERIRQVEAKAWERVKVQLSMLSLDK